MSAARAHPHTIWVLTTSRADFGIYRSVLAALDAHPRLAPALVVTGMHVDARHGASLEAVRGSGYRIAAEFACLEPGDAPADTARSMARATAGMADALEAVPESEAPALLLTLGDRFEMLGAALAAVPFRLPVAHIHGGEETEGAVDNVFRHMLTKMSQLHFAATERSATRIRQMGEPDARVVVSGAPALDSLATLSPLPDAEMRTRFGLDMDRPFHLVTYHPVTLAPETSRAELAALLEVLGETDETLVFSGTNADTGGLDARAAIDAWAGGRSHVVRVESFGAPAYYTAMRRAQTLLGNSSSGILEAAGAGLPVVNIGSRQKGRERSANVVDCAGTPEAIRAAWEAARALRGRDFANVYGRGGAGATIAATIADFLDSTPPARRAVKAFTERPQP